MYIYTQYQFYGKYISSDTFHFRGIWTYMYAKLGKITLSNLRVKRRDLQPNSAFPLISSSSTTNPMEKNTKFNLTQFFGFMGRTCTKITQFWPTNLKHKGTNEAISSSSATNPMEIITNVMSDPIYVLQVRTCAK